MIRYATCSDKGKVRKDNEDFVLAKTPLFAVADGMGGHNAGDVASQLAIEVIAKNFPKKPQNVQKSLEGCLKEGNRKVLERAKKISNEKGMGTTLTLMALINSIAYFGHIGDSRAYLLRGGKLKQLTKDHSLVADLVKQGKLSEDEAQKHPYRNIITKALGSQANIKADYFQEELAAGDKILLCSDGLNTMVEDKKIAKILSSPLPLKVACRQLVEAANNSGGQDNISVVLVEIGQDKMKQSKKLWLSLASIFLGLCLTFLIGYYAVGYIADNSYYLGFYRKKVAVFQGLPYRIAGLKFSKVKKVSDIDKKSLASVWRKRLEKKITVASYKEASQSLDNIAKEGRIESKK
ncbi:MAG: Stp1/IreP family PP2C-type Ser/Thr phosphatase [Actinobacteria bacterium]|nr:MAG: Stp1/IreP family PP2C-type Ser/Thr phosphatase [Actinomycetota bacterium]